MKKICLFHFSPLELFPPVMNMIKYLEEELPENCQVRVYTTNPQKGIRLYSPKSRKVRIFRYADYRVKQSAISRYRLYLSFNIGSLLNAWLWNADDIVYYESFSALPPYFLKKWKPATRLYIHYHEYVGPAEYDAIALLRKLHKLEKKIYDQSVWISHTNMERMKLFLRDVGLEPSGRMQIMPNYPPAEWRTDSAGKKISAPVKIIYVGAIGLEGLYIKEFAQWVERQQGRVTWDLYSQQDESELLAFLTSLNSRYTRFKGFVPYYEMPAVLARYDVGVILYKGLSENFIYNAPNKLFEYLARGLDVWIPKELLGAYPYIRKDSYPKIVDISFTELDALHLDQLVDRDQLPYIPSSYFCEAEYKKLKDLL